jgi:hypothetical protein
MKTLICNCNQTLPLDAPALKRALAKTPGASTDGLDITPHPAVPARGGLLPARGQGNHGQRRRTAGGLHPGAPPVSGVEPGDRRRGRVQERPIRFVNIREAAGWSQKARRPRPRSPR